MIDRSRDGVIPPAGIPPDGYAIADYNSRFPVKQALPHKAAVYGKSWGHPIHSPQ